MRHLERSLDLLGMAPAVAPVSAELTVTQVDKVVAADFVAEDEIGLEEWTSVRNFAANTQPPLRVLEAPVAVRIHPCARWCPWPARTLATACLI